MLSSRLMDCLFFFFFPVAIEELPYFYVFIVIHLLLWHKILGLLKGLYLSALKLEKIPLKTARNTPDVLKALFLFICFYDSHIVFVHIWNSLMGLGFFELVIFLLTPRKQPNDNSFHIFHL